MTVVFDAYVRKTFPEMLLNLHEVEPLFAEEIHVVITDEKNAGRVWKALEKKISRSACNMITHVWLSEIEKVDLLIFRFICKVFKHEESIETNFADPDVLEMQQIAKKVSFEKHRLIQFVRFQKAADNIFFAPVAPVFNSLPLAIHHFIDRFADQKWVIYDTKRKYGYYYDLKKAVEMTLDTEDSFPYGQLDENLMAEDEKLFQELWKSYFKALTIKERINLKLHRQHMPRRYWKYITEKR